MKSFYLYFCNKINSHTLYFKMHCRIGAIKIYLFILFFGMGFYGYAQQEPLENIKITVAFDNDPSASVQVIKTPLRYNKDFGVILQMDNANIDVFSKVYDYFRGFSGYPGLFFTSGVINNPVFFKMGTNIYSFNQQGIDVHDTDPDILTWSNIQTLWAAFFDVANQGMTSPPSSDDYYEVNRNISYSTYRFNESFSQPKFHPDIYVVPNNAQSQINVAKIAGNLAIYSESAAAVPNPFNVSNFSSFYNFELKRSHITTNLFNDISQLAVQSQNGDHFIGSYYCSGFDKTGEISFGEFQNQMNQVANAYGRDGLDNIWVASAKEVFEYLNLKEKINVIQSVNNNKLEITFSANNLPMDYRYYVLTLIVTSNEHITGVNITGANQTNYKYNSDSALINLDWEGGNPPTPYQLFNNAYLEAQQSPDSAHCLILYDYLRMISNPDSVARYQDMLCGICTSVNFDFCNYEFNVPNDTICKGDTVTLTAPDDMQSYLWSNDSITQSIKIAPDTTTDYWVEVVTQDGKTSRDTATVVVFDPPVIVAAQLDTIAILADTTDTLWVSVNDEVTYLWSTGDTDSSIIVPAPEEGFDNYWVDITKDYTVHQCTVRKDFVTQVSFQSIVDFTWDTACFGDTATLIASIQTNDSIVAVKWDLNEDGEFEDATGDTVKHVFVTPGNILVGLRVIFFSGTMDVAYNSVPVADNPVADFSFNNTCLGTTTLFHDSSKVTVGEVVQWDWDYGDGGTGSYFESSHYYQEVGGYNVKLVSTSSFGCKDSTNRTVVITQPDELLLKSDDGTVISYNDTVYFNKGSAVVMIVQNFGIYDSVIWNGSHKGISFEISQEGAYSVVGYKGGCTTTKTFFAVQQGSTPGPGPATTKVMNLFTPNGDGYNDVWIINTEDIVFPIKVTVYNRFGRAVYSSDNYQNDWNGFYKGNPVPQATYYYVIEDTNGNFFRGPVTIVR